MKEQSEYQPIFWDFTGFDKCSVHVCSDKPLDVKTMQRGFLYFYRDDNDVNYNGLRCAFKVSDTEVRRIGLSSEWKLVKEPLRTSVNECFNEKIASSISEDEKNTLRDVVTRTARLCSTSAKSTLNPSSRIRKLNALDDQYHLLEAEFRTALETRHKYNLTLKPIPGGVGEDEWKNRCNKFRAAGIRLLNDIDSNIPKNFHDEVPITSMYSAMRNMKNKLPVLNDRDLDGEKIFLINQALERARRELEFIPEKNPTNQGDYNKKLEAHFENREQMQVLSQQMLGHSNPKMRMIGVSLVLMTGLLVGLLFAVPTFGASMALPIAMGAAVAGLLPFLQPAVMGAAGLALVVLNREKGGAKAMSHFKQQVKDMNKEINEDIKGEIKFS